MHGIAPSPQMSPAVDGISAFDSGEIVISEEEILSDLLYPASMAGAGASSVRAKVGH
jgi:hypothetical protein